MFVAGFEPGEDTDYDLWPDGWTRQRGKGFPRYVQMQIVATDPAEGMGCLRADMNGGAAAAYGPPLAVTADHSYLLEGAVKTDGLDHDRAYLSLTFVDAKRRPLATLNSERIVGSQGWTPLRIGPVTTGSAEATHVLVGVHVEPTDRQDIRGAALFDGLRLTRLPTLRLSGSRSLEIYSEPQQVEVTCRVSGVEAGNPTVSFELYDALGSRVGQWERPLQDPATVESAIKARPAPDAARLETVIQWKPPITQFGYYRVVARLSGEGGLDRRGELCLAVVPWQPTPIKGEFGWTLPRGAEHWTLSEWAELLPQVGINWVKLPLWLDTSEGPSVDELLLLFERLEVQGIEVVGMLSEPPPVVHDTLGLARGAEAAEIFSLPTERWYVPLEPVFSRLAPRVRWWQLGGDFDASFAGYPHLDTRLQEVGDLLRRQSPGARVGVAWDLAGEPPAAKLPCQFVTLSTDQPSNEEAIARGLADNKADARKWLVLQPLAAKDAGPTDRARDLVRRMLAARMAGTDCVYLADPLDAEHGLFRPDGTPGDLLVPWRTTALALAGAEYVGKAELPAGSGNAVFVRGGEAVMVLWSETPRRETAYLGEGVVHSDLWGRQLPILRQGQVQQFEVGPLPSFVTGISEGLIRTSVSVAFEHDRLPSVLGAPHRNEIRFRNYFGRDVTGKVRLIVPRGWRVEPEETGFKLAAGAEQRVPFNLTFPFDAATGPQDVQVELEIAADRRYVFSTNRPIELGLGDVRLSVVTRRDERGMLLVEQRLENLTDQAVSFQCELLAPGRRRQRTQVWELGRGQDVQTYPLTNAKELVGQDVWVRAEEIGGQRILRCRCTVQDQDLSTDQKPEALQEPDAAVTPKSP